MDDICDAFTRQGLCRAPDDRVPGGVATGLGRRVGLGPPAVGRARRPARKHMPLGQFQTGRHTDARTPRRRRNVT